MSAALHSLLDRQLKLALNIRSAEVATLLPTQWQSLIAMVDQAYRDSDADRALVQRSVEIASQELVERNQKLLLQNFKLQLAEKDVRNSRDQLENRVAARTAELTLAKETAEQNEQHFQLLLNSTGEGIYGIDTRGICTFVNIAAAKMLGFEISEIIGRNVHELIHFKRMDGTPHPVEQCPIYTSALAQQVCPVREDVFWKKDHTALQVEYSAHPMRSGSKFIGSVVAFSDISARKEVELALRHAKELAERASLTKSEFLARMSHEIRTPLNGVIGMVDQLILTDQTDKQRRYTQLARVAAESLMEVINDILDFSKIEAGRVEIETVEINLSAMIGDLVELYTPIAGKKNLAIHAHISGSLPPIMTGDFNRIRQVITNLVSNAVKFTAAGSIRIHVLNVATDRDRCTFRLEVSDTGMGIPADRMDRLFKSFSQFDTSTTRRFGGTGLGLVICKRLVELMGGEIGVVSQPGQGTTFWITLSLGIPAIQNTNPVVHPNTNKIKSISALKGLHILVAEDNAMNQYVTQAILKQAGCTCEFASNGAIAVTTFEHNRYDAILMDCQMPTMGGIEATKIIRNIEMVKGTKSHIPIIALTAEAITGDREKCLAAGMDGYVTKPIRAALLFEELDRCIAPAGVCL